MGRSVFVAFALFTTVVAGRAPAADDNVTFVNDTKAAAVIHVIKTTNAATCEPPPIKFAGSASNMVRADDRWTEALGNGCWSWSPGADNFNDKSLATWCVMKPGVTYRLSDKASGRCRVED
jgi:hypothetical protein